MAVRIVYLTFLLCASLPFLTYSQEIAWSTPHMKPLGDRSAQPEAWLGTSQGLTYLVLAGESSVHILQLDEEGQVLRTLNPEMKIGRSEGTYLLSALLADRLVVFAATSRGKSTAYQVNALGYHLPDLEPMGNWKRVETGPTTLGEYIGSPHAFALRCSPNRVRAALLTAAYPNPRVKGHTMVATVLDTGLQVLERHIIHARQDDPLQQPDDFSLSDSGGVWLYQHDVAAGKIHGKWLSLTGADSTWELSTEGQHLHSVRLTRPKAERWVMTGFYGAAQLPQHEGIFQVDLMANEGRVGEVHLLPLTELPPRMTTDPRFSLDLQPFAYQPTHWLPRPKGGAFFIAEQRLGGAANNDPHQREAIEPLPARLFPQTRATSKRLAYQGILVVAIDAANRVQNIEFLPRQGATKQATHHLSHSGWLPHEFPEQDLGYTAALQDDVLHLAFNEYPDELGKPLSARAHNGKFDVDEASLIHWRWDGQGEPRSWPLFDNHSTHIYLQPRRCAQTTDRMWWLYARSESPKQFFIGWMGW
jgi:hypothetical protein